MTHSPDLEAVLQQAFATTIPPAERARIADSLRHAATTAPGSRLRLPTPRLALRSIAVAALMALVALGSLFTYIRLAAPTPVSAARILHRAAMALDPPRNAAIHEVSAWRYGSAPGEVDTIETWTVVNGAGNPLRAALYQRHAGAVRYTLIADAAGNLWSDSGQSGKRYHSTWIPGQPLFVPPAATDPMGIVYLVKQTITSPQSPAAMRALLETAAQGRDATVLPAGTVDGHPVDVVQVSRSTPINGWRPTPDAVQDVITVYIDSSTYLIRRIDTHSVNGAGVIQNDQQLDVTTYASLPPSQAPPGAFQVPAR